MLEEDDNYDHCNDQGNRHSGGPQGVTKRLPFEAEGVLKVNVDDN